MLFHPKFRDSYARKTSMNRPIAYPLRRQTLPSVPLRPPAAAVLRLTPITILPRRGHRGSHNEPPPDLGSIFSPGAAVPHHNDRNECAPRRLRDDAAPMTHSVRHDAPKTRHQRRQNKIVRAAPISQRCRWLNGCGRRTRMSLLCDPNGPERSRVGHASRHRNG